MLLKNKRLIKSSLYYLARWRLARLTAYLLLLTTNRHQVLKAAPADAKRALILNPGKDGVLQDVETCFDGAQPFELIGWPNYALDQIAAAILAPGLSHNRYVTDDPNVDASKQNYRRFLRNVWKHYSARLPVNVVMSVNFGYYLQREFAAALEESGTPFIVLHKENFNGITPRRADFWRVVYQKGRGKFTGRKILVYNEIERTLQISSGIVEPENVVVTGMPRLDRIHQWRREHAGQDIKRRQVLFFGFSRKEKVPVIVGKKRHTLQWAPGTATVLDDIEELWSELSWDQLSAGTCEAIATFARQRPDVQVIVKTKAQSIQMTDTMALLTAGGELPPNVRMISGGDPFQLLTESSVVVGFNTTGLVEAVAAGTPVVVPWFAEACEEAMSDIIVDLGDAVDYAHSPQEMVKLISAHIERGVKVPAELSAQCSEMLRRLVGNDDGAASRRVLEAVNREIEAR